jgi:hypothetical protein
VSISDTTIPLAFKKNEDHNHMDDVEGLTLAAPLPNISTVSKSASLNISSPSDSSASVSGFMNTASVDNDDSLVSSAKRGKKFGFDEEDNQDLSGVGGVKKASEVCTRTAVTTTARTAIVDVVVFLVGDIVMVQERLLMKGW